MSAAPFDVRMIQQRLKAEVAELRVVGLSADYAAVTGLKDFPAPCAYVLLASEKAESKATGHAKPGEVAPTSQMAAVAFGVAYVVRNAREKRGEQLADELKLIVGKGRGALMGFVPDNPGSRPIQFVRGDLMDYNASTALWVDVYQTQHSIRSMP